MLVMRRRVGQSIVLGDGIEIEILEVSSNRVKLGINAPREITVSRKETEITKQENVAAAQGDALALLGLLRIQAPRRD